MSNVGRHDYPCAKWWGLLILVLIWVVFFNTRAWPIGLRVESDEANYWLALIAIIALPLSALAFSITLAHRILRTLCVAASVISLLPFGAVAIFTGLDIQKIQQRGRDTSFQVIDEASVGSFSYKLYLSNCGATCAYGLELRRELPGPFGLKLVQPLWSKYATGDEGTLRLRSESQIEILDQGKIVGVAQI